MANTSANAEQRVIKKFYGRFKAELDAFSKSIEGIPDGDALRSYATVMLGRLMFVYFIQSNGFLHSDYLRKRLVESKSRGKDRFYDDVIRPLLSDGFAKGREDNPLSARKAHIPDAAFERAIDFFDRYRWRLDERSAGRDDEINADVLGYILERLINQRQMGAYYTREDVTGYIGRNTIIPSLFDAARQLYEDAFEGERPAWRLLQADPDRYIYPSLKKGIELPLPEEIRARFDAAASRAEPSGPAPAAYAVPGESWREVVARRVHYRQVRASLEGGEIRGINDLITYNLDAARFARDVIESCESAGALAAFWQALEKITVLDPACGSGAFLFAALKILEPLYAACLDRMQTFLDEAGRAGVKHISKESKGFRETLRRAGEERNINRRYFILKSIIANNLYGVDLMDEAAELCKLRLALKLLAQLRPEDYAGSLLDLDFNIRAGNALVGFAADAARRTDEAERNGIQENRDALREKLNGRLARQYSIEPDEKEAYEKWLASHKPFHWAVEFNEVVNDGGFAVIIGNPPYVNASKARLRYSIKDYQTESCPDVYAWSLERACDLLRPGGRTGMIVPISLSFSGELDSCRRLILDSYGENWFSSFARIPAALFSFDVRVRNTIHIGHKSSGAARQHTTPQHTTPQHTTRQHTTRLHRWFESARPHLFELLQYAPFTPELWLNRIPKFSSFALARAFERALAQTGSTLATSLSSKPTPHVLRFKKTAYNWLNFCRDLPPCYDRGGVSVPHTKFGSVYFEDATTRDLAFLLLNGKLAFAFWCVVGDDFDVTRRMFADFPINLRSLSGRASASLLRLAEELEELMVRNTSFKLNAGRRVGNYNLAKCREVTDKSDLIFAEHMGFQNAWPDVELMYEQIVKTDFSDHSES